MSKYDDKANYVERNETKPCGTHKLQNKTMFAIDSIEYYRIQIYRIHMDSYMMES